MSGIAQKIAEIEAEIARTQRNKATEGHLGLLKAKIAKLRKQEVDSIMGGKSGGGEGFDVSKSGDSRIGLIGFPSVGKSTLLTKITDTFSEVNEREFTTLTCIPGVITYRGSKLQLLDLPGIIEGAAEGKGLGHYFLRHIERNSTLLFLVPADADDIKKEYEILLDELRRYNPEMLDKDRLIVISKCDMLDDELKAELKKQLDKELKGTPYMFISSVAQQGLQELKDKLWQMLNVETK